MKSGELHRHYTLAMIVVYSVVVVVAIVVVVVAAVVVVAVAIGVPNYLMMLVVDVVVVVVAPSMVVMIFLVVVVVVVGPNLLLLLHVPSLLLFPTHHLAHTSPCLFLACLSLCLLLSFLPMSYLFLPTVLDLCLCPFPGACLLLYWCNPFLYALSRYILHIVALFPLLPRPKVMRTHVQSVHLPYNCGTYHHPCPCLFPSEKHQGHEDLVPKSLARPDATNPVHLDFGNGSYHFRRGERPTGRSTGLARIARDQLLGHFSPLLFSFARPSSTPCHPSSSQACPL